MPGAADRSLNVTSLTSFYYLGSTLCTARRGGTGKLQRPSGQYRMADGSPRSSAPAVPCNCGAGCLGKRARMGKSTHHGASCWPGISQVSQLRAFEQIVATHRMLDPGCSQLVRRKGGPLPGRLSRQAVGPRLTVLLLACHASETWTQRQNAKWHVAICEETHGTCIIRIKDRKQVGKTEQAILRRTKHSQSGNQ